MSAALVVEGLCGGYGELAVFRGVDLAATPQRLIGILGPNGAGKTTLLRTIAGTLPPQAGRVRLGERDVTPLRAHRRARLGLVMVPEGRQIFARLSVGENLGLSRAAGRLDGAAFQRRRDEVLTLFPRLSERLGESGGSLSGGEQQMLAIGRALLLDPQVLLLDEPTQGLAPIVIGQLLAALTPLKGRFTMIVVEQNLAFLQELADHTLVMRGGVLTHQEDTANAR